jgi:multidrug transporter EmrE-like cation transporter
MMVVLSVLLSSAGQTLLKLGLNASDAGSAEGAVAFMLRAFASWQVWAGLVLFASSVLVWMRVLSTSELSWGYPLLGLSYVFVALVGVFVFGEHLSALRLAGIALVILGAALVGSS